jgi:hypothetical protein
MLNNKPFAIMPAHCVIYNVNNNWVRSNFLEQLSTNKLLWNVPTKWLTSQELHDDFAWAPLNDVSNMAPMTSTNVTQMDESFCAHFVHPNSTVTDSVIGKINGLMYRKPHTDLFESCNIGFTGMSGALITQFYDTIAVGMFIRRGYLGNGSNPMTLPVGTILPVSVMEKHVVSNNSIDLAKFLK